MLLVAITIGSTGVAQPAPGGAVVGGAANPAVTSHVITLSGRPHQLIVVDSRERTVAVYQVNPDSGEISLASVRNITWDLKMEELNSKRFLPPKDIREGLKATQ